MDKKSSFKQKREDVNHPKPFYVDGCKVTVHYSKDENPKAMREIRDILLSGAKVRKS